MPPLLVPSLTVYQFKCYSNSNIAMLSGAKTIDGISVGTGDRVLVGGQTDPVQNGPYIAQGGGAWLRTSFPAGASSDRLIYVAQGGVYGKSFFTVSPTNPSYGVDAVTVTQQLFQASAGAFSGILAVAHGGTGIDGSTVTANTFLASPNGSAGALGTRAIVLNDLPAIPPSKISYPTATAATPVTITGAGFVLYRKTDNNVEVFDGAEANAKLVQGLSVAAPAASVVQFAPNGTFLPMGGLSSGVRYKAKQDGTIVPEADMITGPFTLIVGIGETQSGVPGLRVQMEPYKAA